MTYYLVLILSIVAAFTAYQFYMMTREMNEEFVEPKKKHKKRRKKCLNI